MLTNCSRGFEVVKGFEDFPVTLPVRSTSGSAGYDFFALFDCPLSKGEICAIKTGVKAYMQPGEVLILANRSSNPAKGLELANGIGVVDRDYYGNPDNDGHIMFLFKATQDVFVKAGQKIGQGLFMPFLTADNDTTTTQRVGGFGSTDETTM